MQMAKPRKSRSDGLQNRERVLQAADVILGAAVGASLELVIREACVPAHARHAFAAGRTRQSGEAMPV